MRLRLTPRDDSFYELFSKAADNNVAGARLLAEIVSPGADRRALAAPMRDLEHVGDRITHEVIRKLAASFITPFDREDIYRLASDLDDVMDLMEAAADLVVLYAIDDLPPETVAAVDVVLRGAELTAQAMPSLASMKGLQDYWIEINRLENEADQLYRRTLARLFNGTYDALTVLKLKEVAEQVEAAADALENLADAIETIVVKES